jgi:hypothetical protein
MATVLFAWELGANLGHILPLSRVAGALGGDHRAVYAVRDLAQAEATLAAEDEMLQAPAWPEHRHLGARGPLSGYADILAAAGFGDALKLSAMMRAWSALIERVAPDVVVADHAPGLQAALQGGGIPVVAMGTTFTMPPLGYDRFPPLKGDRIPVVPEARLLDALRKAQGRRGRTPVGAILDVFRTKHRVVCGLPELDPYRGFRREEVATPPGGLPTAQPWPKERRLFAYVGGEIPNFEALMQALAMVSIPVEVFLRGESGPVPEFLRMRGITVHETPPPLGDVMARASHIISQGGAGTVAAAFAAGRPQLVIPIHDEAEINLDLLEEYGVGKGLSIATDPKEVTVKIEEFVADTELPDNALEQAHRISGRELRDGAEAAAAAIQSALAGN